MTQLRFHDVRVLSSMLWLLAKLAILQRVLALPDLVRFFDPPPNRNRSPKRGADSAEVDRLVWLSRALLHRVYRDGFCMQQSLVLFYLLRRRNYPVRIRFGIVSKDGTLAGHAWLEQKGRPVVEHRDPKGVYATTFSYPSLT